MSAHAGPGVRKPPRTIAVEPSAFVDAWPDKPKTAIAVGLRLLSDQDIQTARAMAARYAQTLFLGEDVDCTDPMSRVEAFNDGLMRWAIACGVTDPNNASIPFFAGGDDVVRLALTTQGIRFLWDHLERVALELSPLVQEATDLQLGELVVLLPRLDRMKPEGARRARKLLAFVLEELRSVQGSMPRAELDAVAEYIVRP